jgi:MFS family permease
MRDILGQRPLRFVFAANVISMLGSGMNSAAVAWYILEATHSEMALGTFAVLQTIPAMLMHPFTGVIIDREDRRRLVMWLDALRAVIILSVCILAFRHRVQIWQLYLMNTLVAAGFWMFWPTITALIQELTPEGQFVQSNTFLLAGVQGGWLIAGSLVGFMYNHIGLGGVLLIDVSTYVVSFLCYFAVRKGRHVVLRPEELRADIIAAETQLQRFWREMREGLHFLRDHRPVILLGISWALFLGAMITGVVITPSLSERIFHAGAVGYGWLNAGWGTGAFLSALYAPAIIASLGGRRSVAFSMAIIAACIVCAPVSRWLAAAVLLYGVMGFRTRRRRHRHEHQPDGNGPGAPHGTSAKHVLFLRHLPPACARTRGRSRGPQHQSGRCFRNPGLRVWVIVCGGKLARGSINRSRRSQRGEINQDTTEAQRHGETFHLLIFSVPPCLRGG